MLYKRILAGTFAAVLILGTGCTGKTAESAETTETSTAAESDGSNSEPTVEPMVSMNAHSGKAVSAEQAKQERIRLVKKLAKGSLDDESAGYLADFINELHASLSQSAKDNGMEVRFGMTMTDYGKVQSELPTGQKIYDKKSLYSGSIHYKGSQIEASMHSQTNNYTVYSDGRTAYYEHMIPDSSVKEQQKKTADRDTAIPKSAVHAYRYKINLTDESNKTTVIGSAPVSDSPELISEFIDNIKSVKCSYESKVPIFNSAGQGDNTVRSADTDTTYFAQDDREGQQLYNAGKFYKRYDFTLKYPVYEDIKAMESSMAEPDGPNGTLTVLIDSGKVAELWYTLGTDDDIAEDLSINFWYNPQGHEFTIEPPEDIESYPDIKDAEYPYDAVGAIRSITELS